MTSNWELANEGLLIYAEHLHDQMRKMYSIPPHNMLDPGKLKEVKKTELGPLSRDYLDPDGILQSSRVLSRQEEMKFAEDLKRAVNENAYRQDFPPEDKTLLQKSHPEECICPKCKTKTGIVSTVKRIGDEERDACLVLLQDRHVSGHITLDEFEVRKDRALSAKTQSELDFLTQDLPPLLVKKTIIVQPASRGSSPWWYAASAMVFLGNAGFSEIAAGSWMLCVTFLVCAVAMSCVWMAKRSRGTA